MSTITAQKPGVITSAHIPKLICPKSFHTVPDEQKTEFTPSPAYAALVNLCIAAGRPTGYPDDILVHTREWMEKESMSAQTDGGDFTGDGQNKPFVLALCESGIYTTALGSNQAVERLEMTGRDRGDTLYIWDGSLLYATDFEAAKAFLLTQDIAVSEPRRFTATFQVPTFDQLIGSLPYHLRSGVARDGKKIADTLKYLYQREVEVLFRDASRCGEAVATMGVFYRDGRQWTCFFQVRDVAVAYEPGKMNFHGQNTSQCVYMGSITVHEDAEYGHLVGSNH